MRPLLLAGIASLAGFALATSTAAQAHAPAPPLNLQVLPKTLTHAQVVRRMRSLDVGLGVKCSLCHVKADYASDALDSKLIARRMLRMVDAINRDNFSGRPEITCYTCHRGHRRPLRQPPIPVGWRGPLRGCAARPACAHAGLGARGPKPALRLAGAAPNSSSGGGPPFGISRPFAPISPAGKAARPPRAGDGR